MNIISSIKDSATELKNTRSLTEAALLTAISIVLGSYCKIIISPTMEIRFGFLGLAMSGMFLGPVTGGIIGAVADIITYFIRPNGFFFPGFTLNQFIYGFVFGLFFYKKKVTVKRVILSKLVLTVIISLVLNPIWLNMMYGSELFALPRLIKAVVLFPVECGLLYFMAITAEKIRSGKKSYS